MVWGNRDSKPTIPSLIHIVYAPSTCSQKWYIEFTTQSPVSHCQTRMKYWRNVWIRLSAKMEVWTHPGPKQSGRLTHLANSKFQHQFKTSRVCAPSLVTPSDPRETNMRDRLASKRHPSKKNVDDDDYKSA